MRFIMFVAMLGLVLLSGCSQNQPIGNFPPPEGYASWEEYNQQYNSQAAATPVSTPTPTVTTPSPTTTSTLLPTTTATSVPTTTAATNPITTTAPAPIMFNLEIAINPEGSGTVTPSGASYEQGTQIELLANPADGFVFSHWEGDISGTSPNVSITIDEHKTIIANFNDIRPPVISEVAISKIKDNTALLTWTTSKPTECLVEYGQTVDYEFNMSADTSDGRIHTASMENLDPETIYHFRVISVDEHENTATSDDYNFTTKRTEDLVTSILYPSMTIGGRVHNLSFNLFNGSSQRITVTKVEILDGADSIVFTMGNSDIVETWGSGIVISGNSVSAGISFGIPPTTTDVQNWSVKWYCTHATGGDLIIFGSHTTF